MKSKQIRKQFFNFFESKNHHIVPSSPIVMKDDPTLLFTNAGMNQFKSYILGNENPKHKRLADSQKCLRVSGKHNDLEEVGYDTYHHTMFEMLGNWSFGDYFKKEAIEWAWELLTDVYGIDKDMLYVTVFEGSEEDGLSIDQEAYDYWSNIISKDRIILGNKKDNFWEMGDQGPCGPCSEIHVDIRTDEEKRELSGKELVNKDHPQVVEIWNLVFMEFNRKADGSLESLPAKHVDTGMGFERLCMVLQGKRSNYDTDVFIPLIKEIEKVTDTKYGINEKIDIAIRIIADHVRAVSFSIADGQLPSNTGAGYVIRRILRRALRYGFSFLHQKTPFIYKLIKILKEQMGEAFPEIEKQYQLIENVMREEEESFLRTLEQGLILLDNLIAHSDNKTIDGRKAFELYDTYGFPLDLTQLILKEKGYLVDINGFESAMNEQKSRSRSASAVETDDWNELINIAEESFIGYDYLDTEIFIAKYRKIHSKKEGDRFQLVFNRTPFYAESGGQVGDIGYIEGNDGEKIEIIDTKRENNQIVHITKKLPKNIIQPFKAVVDRGSRYLSASNHTATHLLHQALRHVLGEHVEQKGSLVSPTHLRFDFSHFSKIEPEQLNEIENFVNDRIKENISLEENRSVTMDEAVKQGAIALFGEKYGEKVRTIRFGKSIELCGGIHVSSTKDIWYFKIMSESAIAAGIRRVEAITNKAAMDYFAQIDDIYTSLKAQLKNPKDILKSVEHLQEENKKLRKEMEKLQQKQAKSLKKELIEELKEVNGIKFLAKTLNYDINVLKDIAFGVKNSSDNVMFVAGSENNGKANLIVAISEELVNKRNINAGNIIRSLAKNIQGGGGGQPHFATAGGKYPQGIQKALNEAEQMIKKL